ncbi:MAG: helix-turn-helix transcriptional regulator [Proteobacteria bacterium]|nr:helix-turn-helix transcriptional regulator [Pseudomonadota bacterium]
MPSIIAFLGSDPCPASRSLGEQLMSARRRRGFSQREAAKLLGVDVGTLGRWERGIRTPSGDKRVGSLSGS